MGTVPEMTHYAKPVDEKTPAGGHVNDADLYKPAHTEGPGSESAKPKPEHLVEAMNAAMGSKELVRGGEEVKGDPGKQAVGGTSKSPDIQR